MSDVSASHIATARLDDLGYGIFQAVSFGFRI